MACFLFEKSENDCDDGEDVIVCSEQSPSYSLIVNKKSSGLDNHVPSRPLWRKREVVKQERIVHYTTVDADGVQQVCSLLSFARHSIVCLAFLIMFMMFMIDRP